MPSRLVSLLTVLAALSACAAAAHAGPARAAHRAGASLALTGALDGSAAHAFDRGFFTSSPGGVRASAARVAQWRPLVVREARRSGFGANLLEALVFVESSGRPDAVAGDHAGLTQLSPATARRAHLHVALSRSRALTRRIGRAEARGAYVTARQLRRWRTRYDQRFAPQPSLRATARYLVRARRTLGRADLAVAAYHSGIGRIRDAVRAFGGDGTPSYAELYFGSTPLEHRSTWSRLASTGDYYWKVLAAKRVMRLYRTDPSALSYEAELQARKNSAEEVLHPRYRTLRFASPRTIARAWKRHLLRAIPRDPHRTHIAFDRSFGDQAHKLGRSKRLYRGLRPATLDVLLYIGRHVHELSGVRKPLLLTSALRDARYQRVLMRVNANAARTYSLHTTGYAFDIARSYAGARQAAAFEFVLDRLQAVNAIAFIRESAAIHVAVAADAPRKLQLLAGAG